MRWAQRGLSGTTEPTAYDGGIKVGEKEGEAAEGEKKEEKEEGYEWNQLPHIGDVVWALRGEEGKKSWYPVRVIEPPTEDPGQPSSTSCLC